MLLTLTIYHAWKEYRSQKEITRVPLLRVLYRGELDFTVQIGDLAPYRWGVVLEHDGRCPHLEHTNSTRNPSPTP